MDTLLSGEYTYTVEYQDKKVVSPPLKIIDGVRLFPMRSGLFNDSKKNVNDTYPLEQGGRFTYLDGVDGVYPRLKDDGYYFNPMILRDGWVYVYNSDKREVFTYECINNHFTLKEAIHVDTGTITTEKVAQTMDFIYLSVEDKVTILYSVVKFSESFIKSTYKEKPIGAYFDCKKWIEGEQADVKNRRLDVDTVWFMYDQPPGQNERYAKSIADNYKKVIDAAIKQNSEKKKKYRDIFLVLDDPFGVADTLCDEFDAWARNLLAVSLSLKTGDLNKAFEMINKNAFDSANLDPELSALIDMGSIIYRMHNTKTSLFRRYNSFTQLDLLKKVLKVEERAEIKNRIEKIQQTLKKVMLSRFYQRVVDDYDHANTNNYNEVNTEFIVQCRKCTADHLSYTLADPRALDGYIEVQDTAGKPAQDGQSGETTFFDKIFSEENAVGRLWAQYVNCDVIFSDKYPGLIASYAMGVDGFAGGLMFASTSIDLEPKTEIHAKIFRLGSDKHGNVYEKYIKISCKEMLQEYKNANINLSKLQTTTIEGTGSGFKISLDKVTSVNGVALADVNLKKAMDGATAAITVEELVPDWQRAVAGIQDKKWMNRLNSLVNHPRFLRGMTGLTMLNLAFTLTKEEKGAKEWLSLSGGISYLCYLRTSYTRQSLHFLGIPLTKGFFSGVASVAFGVSTFFDGKDLISSENQQVAGTFAIISGLSGAPGGILVLFSNPKMIAVGVVLIVISIVTDILKEIFRRSELEQILQHCAYGSEYEFSANTGRELLGIAAKKSDSYAMKKRYNIVRDSLPNQQMALNRLIFKGQGGIKAGLKLYFDKTYHQAGPTLIYNSQFLDAIEIEIFTWVMPLIHGELEVYLFNIKENGTEKTNIREVFEMDGSGQSDTAAMPVKVACNVSVNALNGVATVRLKIKDSIKERSLKYFTGGTLRVQIRGVLQNNRTFSYFPSPVDGIDHYATFDFEYQKKCEMTSQMSKELYTEKRVFTETGTPSISLAGVELCQTCELKTMDIKKLVSTH